jgi:hypothetical protein
MRRLAVVIASVVALVFASNAWADYTYAVKAYWTAGDGAGSTWSSSWFQNVIFKDKPFDTTITFIDNGSYSWHSTVRGVGTYLETHWLSSAVKKAHCRANQNGTYAACSVHG